VTASFQPPFAPAAVTRHDDALVTLPDPPHPPAAPVVQPGTARHPGVTLVMLDVSAAAGSFPLSSPVTGVVRNVEVPTGALGSLSQLLELSPLPFGIGRTLRRLPAGAPTLYLGFDRPPNDPADDETVAAGELLATVSTHAYLGLCFGDRVSVAPASWIETIARAMTDAGEPTADVAPWAALAGLYAGTRRVRLLDHAGAPANGRTVDVRITPAGGSPEGPFPLVLPDAPADADLEAAASASPLPLSRGAQPTLFALPTDAVEIRWRGDPPAGDVPLTVHSIYETGASAKPDQFVPLAADRTTAHVLTADASWWFAPRPADPGTSTLPRWVGDSRVEPFNDGFHVFRLLADDLFHATGAGNGAHLAGLNFKDFDLDPRAEGDTTLVALTQRMVDNGAGARFLSNRTVTLARSPEDALEEAAYLLMVLGTEAAIILDGLRVLDTSAWGFVVIAGGDLLLYSLLPKIIAKGIDKLTDLAEPSKTTLPLLNAITAGSALWVPHPATLDHNPLGESLPFELDDIANRFSFWHQKIQVVKRTPDDAGDWLIGYVGGMDVVPNRLDSPGHESRGPYHDVHARVTGPAAALLAATFAERWAFHQTDALTSAPDSEDDFNHVSLEDFPDTPGPAAPLFETPAPDDPQLLARSARHLVSVGRTYFRRADGTSPFAFAPEGERTIHEGLVRAIHSARDYIFIEDQYFTPESADPPGSTDAYLDALVAAAGHCRRLLIVVPTENDQPFGDIRRRAVFDALSDAWGDRALIGNVFRRPRLADPGRLASEGRFRLLEAVDASAQSIVVGPRARVPAQPPYWLWIGGELMLARASPSPMTAADGTPAMQLPVLRVTTTAERWGANARAHAAGAAVTASQLRAIYLHSKTMVIDDVFLTTGSSNVNRRGFFHDGECNVFVVPEQLRAAPDNPARALRRALWAEHLGLPDAMGRALLSDPISAFDLFRRPAFAGNRFRPHGSIDVNAHLSIPTTDGLIGQVFRAAALSYVASLVPTLWNTVCDPTTFVDPQPNPGPEL
jgi:phosphatidylserine/phosphatidylglycerophosphate/cardiolipin synthase-like enzyme